MRKIIFILVGVALIAGSTQAAFSRERHPARNLQQQFNGERFRNANAHALPSYVPEVRSGYSAEAGAWQSMTGFH
jgi:hypothetical protein